MGMPWRDPSSYCRLKRPHLWGEKGKGWNEEREYEVLETNKARMPVRLTIWSGWTERSGSCRAPKEHESKSAMVAMSCSLAKAFGDHAFYEIL